MLVNLKSVFEKVHKEKYAVALSKLQNVQVYRLWFITTMA